MATDKKAERKTETDSKAKSKKEKEPDADIIRWRFGNMTGAMVANPWTTNRDIRKRIAAIVGVDLNHLTLLDKQDLSVLPDDDSAEERDVIVKVDLKSYESSQAVLDKCSVC